MSGSRPTGDQPPNILWFTTDQQRFDTIAALGNRHVRTPTLDELVRGGAAFRRTYVQSPICTPSRASMMTGRYPASHHVHRNGTDHFPSTENVVTRYFADAGYHCALIGKHHLSRAEHRNEVRPEDGYKTVHLAHDPYPEPRAYGEWLSDRHGVDAYRLHRDLVAHSRRDYGPGVPVAYHHATWWSETAVDFIEAMPSAPWLLNLNPIDPHPPWFPPDEYLRRYDPSSLPLPPVRDSDFTDFERFAAVDQQWRAPFDVRQFDPASERDMSEVPIDERNPWDIPPSTFDPRLVKACYYATIELVDEAFSRVLAALARTGQADNTIIVVTSDHGDMLGDHGLLYKGCRFYDGIVRVPLLMVWPGVIQPGLAANAITESVDIAPTLMEAAGLEIPSNVQGRSLLPIASGLADPSYHKAAAVSEYNDALPMNNASHASMVVGRRYKTVIYHDHDDLGEIYDLQEDPHEFDNLWFAPSSRDLKCGLIAHHLNVIMETSDAGIERSATY